MPPQSCTLTGPHPSVPVPAESAAIRPQPAQARPRTLSTAVKTTRPEPVVKDDAIRSLTVPAQLHLPRMILLLIVISSKIVQFYR